METQDTIKKKFLPPNAPAIGSIGSRIREARLECGLTQKELASMIGAATGTIQQYELNLRQPRKAMVDKITIATHLPSSFFYATPPFEDLRFLFNCKSVVLYALEERGVFGRRGRCVSEISNHEYLSAVAENIVSIVPGGERQLNIQFKPNRKKDGYEYPFSSSIALSNGKESDDYLKALLWGEEAFMITDEMLNEVKEFADYLLSKKKSGAARNATD